MNIRRVRIKPHNIIPPKKREHRLCLRNGVITDERIGTTYSLEQAKELVQSGLVSVNAPEVLKMLGMEHDLR